MRYKHRKLKTIGLLVALLTMVFMPSAILAETLSSPNYNVENPEFNVGGEQSSSTNYTSRDSIGGEGAAGGASTNYKGFWGFLLQSYPGVPGAPTFTNTGGTLYNSLDFIVNTGGSSSDTNYAIAISTDNFATTNYVQANDTIGTSPVWQTYTAWGAGTGQRITGLTASTTYKIKVKARYGADSETGFSAVSTAATVDPSLTMSIAGVNISTVIAGQTTTISTTSTAMSFATLPVGSAVVAAQTITVTTNASGGYTTTLQQDGNLRNPTNSIPPVPASNATPAIWPTSINTGEFGYHTTDGNLCTGTVGRFAVNDTYAAATTTATEVACNTVPVTNEATSLVYKLQIGSLQQAGSYANAVTYITTAIY